MAVKRKKDHFGSLGIVQGSRSRIGIRNSDVIMTQGTYRPQGCTLWPVCSWWSLLSMRKQLGSVCSRATCRWHLWVQRSWLWKRLMMMPDHCEFYKLKNYVVWAKTNDPFLPTQRFSNFGIWGNIVIVTMSFYKALTHRHFLNCFISISLS